nr:unnamed protein product [Callosobruchus chinensis]CAH7747102.1 unnamed protein product [Callosobruchus chinensis]CAH7756323.1 unnamed protein product [Callosobruchus chinensis]
MQSREGQFDSSVTRA